MNAATKTTPAKPPRAAIEVDVEMPEELTTISLPLGMMTLDFAHGQSIIVATEQLTPEILGQAIMHGLKQKLVDAAAISRDPATGRAASITTKYDAVREVYQRLLSGEWNKRREGGGTSGGLLFRALVQMYDGRKTPEQIKDFLDAKSDKEKAALRKNPTVAKIIDELRAEGGDDTSADLLSELEG